MKNHYLYEMHQHYMNEDEVFGYEEHLRDQPDTIADLDRGEATWDGYKYPQTAWLLSGRDVWYQNPYYEGEGWFYGTFFDYTYPDDDYGHEGDFKDHKFRDWKDMKFEDFTPATKPKAVYVEEEDDPF